MDEHILRKKILQGKPFGKSVRETFGIGKSYYVKEAILFFSRTYVSDARSGKSIMDFPNTVLTCGVNVSESRVTTWMNNVEEKEFVPHVAVLPANLPVPCDKRDFIDLDPDIIKRSRDILNHLVSIGIAKKDDSESYFITPFGLREVAVADHRTAARMHKKGGLVDRGLVVSMVKYHKYSYDYIKPIMDFGLVGGVRYCNRMAYKEIECRGVIFVQREANEKHFLHLNPAVGELTSPSMEYYLTRLNYSYHEATYCRMRIRYFSEDKSECTMNLYLETPNTYTHIEELFISDGYMDDDVYVDFRGLFHRMSGYRIVKAGEPQQIKLWIICTSKSKSIIGVDRSLGVMTSNNNQHRGTKYDAKLPRFIQFATEYRKLDSRIIYSAQSAREDCLHEYVSFTTGRLLLGKL